MSAGTGVVPGGPGSGNHDQGYFDELITAATGTLVGDEVLLANISGERTDFIRLNNSEVRQAGSVDQRSLTVDLVAGRRHTGGSIRLSGDRSVDDARLATLLGQLREQRAFVADDPFLLYNTEPTSTERIERGSIPEPDAALAEIRSAGQGRDLVGIYASGDTFQGFANSLGQRNWFESSTFNLDWCFYLRADKAAKNLYAGFDWDDDAFAAKVDWSARQVKALEREPISLSPGEYRTYLAPRALEELMQLLSYYGAFGIRAHETKQTPLLKMLVEGTTLSPLVNISEDTAHGVAPNFQSAGFLRPDEVPLIVGGAYARDARVTPLGPGVRCANQRCRRPRVPAVAGDHAWHDSDRPCRRGTRERALRRQPLVHELLRPGSVPNDGHDTVRHVLDGRRRNRRTGQRSAFRRHRVSPPR